LTPERLSGVVVDPILEPFLGSPVESAAEHDALGELIDQVRPVMEGVIRGRLAGTVAAIDREELFSEAVLLLIRRLQEVKAEPQRHPIANFSGYAAVTTFNVIYTHFRRIHPERQRLRNRIRHVVRMSARYGVWESQAGQFLCGLGTWAGIVTAESSEAALDQVPPLPLQPVVGWNDAITRPQITRTLDHLFEHTGKPVELERLVEKVAELLRLPILAAPVAATERVDESPSVESSLVARSALGEVWREIGLLMPKQRIALLLSLRDGNGSAITSLLVLLRITTLEGLAESVGMTPVELAGIWDQLPLPDMVIAERLGLTRPQVINARKSARERLGRRLSFLREGNPLLERASS